MLVWYLSSAYMVLIFVLQGLETNRLKRCSTLPSAVRFVSAYVPDYHVLIWCLSLLILAYLKPILAYLSLSDAYPCLSSAYLMLILAYLVLIWHLYLCGAYLMLILAYLTLIYLCGAYLILIWCVSGAYVYWYSGEETAYQKSPSDSTGDQLTI